MRVGAPAVLDELAHDAVGDFAPGRAAPSLTVPAEQMPARRPARRRRWDGGWGGRLVQLVPAVTVLALTEIDEALTAAVEDTGLSPQYIAEAVRCAWLAERGYLSST